MSQPATTRPPAEGISSTDQGVHPKASLLQKYLQLYTIGDRIGAVAEGGAGGSVSYERALKGLKIHPRGTDESDTARLFVRYVATVGIEQFSVTGWYSYHTRNRAYTSYGKTWRDHFNTITYLQALGRLNYDQLLTLSADRRSLGNGCLALACPVALLFGERALEIADQITAGTHALGRPTVRLAVLYCQGRVTLDQVIDQVLPADWEFSWGLTPLAPACLWAAATLAKKTTVKEIIQTALENGGDVDSYLSLALVLWQVRRLRTS